MDLFLSFLGQMLIYGLVAIFLENSLLSRAMGSSTAVWLMRDHRLLLPFGAVLTVTILLSSIGAYFISPWVNQSVYSYELMPLAFSVLICLFYFIAILVTIKVKQPRKQDLRLCIHRSALNSVILGSVLLSTSYGLDLAGVIGFGLGAGIGYTLAVWMLRVAAPRLRSKAIPKSFRGFPAMLIYIGVLSLAVYGMIGHTVAL